LSLPWRVPASRASIRARWKRRTLRAASATWSSAVTPGVLTVGRPPGSATGAATSPWSSWTSSDVEGTGSISVAVPSLVAADHRERRLELRHHRRPQAGIRAEHAIERDQSCFVALEQLDLELCEAIHDLTAQHDLHLVEAQFDARGAIAQLPSAAALADRHQLEQRLVAGELEHQRAGIGNRPVMRRRRLVRGAFELLASVGRRTVAIG
jgi:hypothetical protein